MKKKKKVMKYLVMFNNKVYKLNIVYNDGEDD